MEWSDEEFLSYCDFHSRTDLALFHRKHVARLLRLTGKDIEEDKIPEWQSVDEYTMCFQLFKVEIYKNRSQIDSIFDNWIKTFNENSNEKATEYISDLIKIFKQILSGVVNKTDNLKEERFALSYFYDFLKYIDVSIINNLPKIIKFKEELDKFFNNDMFLSRQRVIAIRDLFAR